MFSRCIQILVIHRKWALIQDGCQTKWRKIGCQSSLFHYYKSFWWMHHFIHENSWTRVAEDVLLVVVGSDGRGIDGDSGGNGGGRVFMAFP